MKKRILWLVLLLIAALTLFASCSAGEILDDALEYLTEEDSADSADYEAAENSETTEEAAADERVLEESADEADEQTASEVDIDPDGHYTDPDSVALYIHTYGCLPDNFLTKRDAEDLGWDSRAGNLDEVAPGCSIGGDKFGNREGLLPKADGRKYYECDVNYDGGYRGGERIVFSNDGLIFYSEDHYQNFVQLY